MDIINDNGVLYGIHPEYTAYFRPEHFLATWWQSQQAIIGQTHGRGTTWFVRLGQEELVLRHYYRGGMLGKLLNDRYLFTGFQRSRAVREFSLLCDMQQQGLPVPAPCAVRFMRQGLFYRTDILLKRIPQATNLVQLLQEHKLSSNTWQHIGHTIRRFHNAHINHSDLNSHNILLDQQHKAWLIDFDKSAKSAQKLSSGAGAWKKANLQRLLRSLQKEQAQHQPFYWQAQDWQALLAGYEQAN